MDHLALEIFSIGNNSSSDFLTLADDTAITIVETSCIFGKGHVFTYEFPLNIRANAHFFGTSGDMRGSRLHDQVDKRTAMLWVEGLPMYLGYLKLGNDVDIDSDGNVNVSFESGRNTFEDMTDGAKASQVPTIGDVPFGIALWRKRWVSFGLKLKAAAVFEDRMTNHSYVTCNGNEYTEFTADGENEGEFVQEYPRMVFPKGRFGDVDSGVYYDFDFLNTDFPYTEDANGTPSHPYCNIALCYQQYDYKKTNENGDVTTDYSAEPEAQRGYEYMPANRVNSAPNFFVIYWIRCLMEHLGIHIDENQMMDVEDLRRLFFVNTNCAYKEPKRIRGNDYDRRFRRYRFAGAGGGRLVPEFYGLPGLELTPSGPVMYIYKPLIRTEDSHLSSTWHRQPSDSRCPPIKRMDVSIEKVRPMSSEEKEEYEEKNGYFHDAFATGDCFPNADIKDVISAIEGGFGIRFVFSGDYKRVRIVLLRNIFRSSEVQKIECDVVSLWKSENSKRGFRMTYGGSEDTAFYYKGFADLLPHKKPYFEDTSDNHDYSHWKLDADYSSVINNISAFDKTCYVTPSNGNAYGIKVDKGAKRYRDLHPAVFEFAGYMDAEDGDCSGEDDTIETVTAGFKPAIMNDLNMEADRGKDGAPPVSEQRFALFVDEKMRVRRPDLQDLQAPKTYNDSDAVYKPMGLYADDSVAKGKTYGDGIVAPGEFSIASDTRGLHSGLHTEIIWNMTSFGVDFSIDGHVSAGYRLYLQDNFEPNDDGVSPIETHDWGITLGIMRGSGSGTRLQRTPDPDDDENDSWELVPGSSVTAHPDTCDSYGNEWDYNGTQPGIGSGERISLKLRAEKPNPYFDPGQPEGESNRRYLAIDNQSLQQRGLCDRFYKEYSKFIREARVANIEARMSLSQMLAIDMTKKTEVQDITGFVLKKQVTVSKKTGLGNTKLELLYI